MKINDVSEAKYATLLKPKKSFTGGLTIGKSYRITSTWSDFFKIVDDFGKTKTYHFSKKHWLYSTLPIIEWSAEDKACELLHDIDFTTESDMIKAVVKVAELIRKYDTLHNITTFCQCDQPDFYHNDNTTCARCNRPFDPGLK